MWIALVVGTVVATRKDERLVGNKLLIVRRLNPENPAEPAEDRAVVAVDRVGAGNGEVVLVVSGSSARAAVGRENAPVDAAIVGIVDRLDVAVGLARPGG